MIKGKPRRTAILLTASWTQVATTKIARQRKGWPAVIVWKRRVFVKATTGYTSEKYVEASAYFAAEEQVRMKQVRDDRLLARVEQLERDTCPHRRAGYD